MDEFEILPSEQWMTFCEGFSRSHRGWLVRLWEVDTASLEAGLDQNRDALIRDLSLWELAAEQDDRYIDLDIVLRKAHSRIAHRVRQVVSISLERDADKHVSGLRIDTEEGQSRLLRFRIPARPKQVV
jgi:hypothetical protein